MTARKYYKRARLEHFRALCEAASTGTFTAAALKLGLSRSTVWQQINALERELNVALFQRCGRTMQLTDDGARLLQLIQEPLAALEQASERFVDQKSESAAVLRLAMLPNTELQPAIAEYRRQDPQTRLVLFERRSMEVLDLVNQNVADLGFALEMPGRPQQTALRSRRIGQREFGLTLPVQHSLARKQKLRLADLAGYPLILGQPDNPMRRPVQSAFQRAGMLQRLSIVVETDDRECATQCVLAGMGIAVGTFEPNRKPPDGICCRSLGYLLGGIPLCLYWHPGRALPPPALAFRRAVCDRVR